MHDIDRTQLEIPQSEVQEEILKRAFGRVAAWLRRQPDTPSVPPPPGGYRGTPLDPLIREIAAAKAELATLLELQREAGDVAHLYGPMIREQRDLIARLEAELNRLRGGR